MVAGDTPEILPEGWTLQFNALKTGRKVKCYVNSGTGQKFFSRDDLIRHTKARNTQVDWPQLTKSPSGSPSNNNQMHLIEYTNERPEWLPHGWIVELKIKNSGSARGRKYKCYVEPSTGYKFYSKPEVFRHLETTGLKSCTSKQKEAVVSMLPTNKVSLRYPDAKVKIEKSTVEDLPTGWIKEIKIQRKTNGIRKDPYYIDPVSGYVFRSKRDVQRYLETGEISTCKILPRRRDIDDETSPSSAAKSQKLELLATSGQLVTGQGYSDGNSIASPEADSLKERGGKTTFALTTVPLATTTEIPSQKIPSDNCTESEKKSNANWTEPTIAEVSKRNQVKDVNADGGPGLVIPQADKKQEQNRDSRIKRDESEKTQNCLSKSRGKKGLNMPRRSSMRLAGIEPEMVANPVSIVQAISEADNKQEQYSPESGIKGSIVQPISGDANKQEHNSPGIKGEGSYERKSQNSFSNSVNKEEHNLPHWSAEQPTMIETEPVANTISIVQALPKMIRSSKREAILAVGMTKDGLADQTIEQIKSEPRKELLLHTSTANSPMLGRPSNKNQRSDTTCPVQPKVKVSERSQHSMVGTDDGPVSTPEVETMRGQKSLESALEWSDLGSSWNSLSTYSYKKAFSLPRRSSKRLAGLEPELVANSEFSGQNAKKKYCRSESNVVVGSTPDDSANIASQQIKGATRIELPHHASINVHNSVHRGSLNKNQVSLHDQTVSKDQPRMLEANRINDEKSESKLVPPFGEFLSDPCLEFAFKTLTGEIPVEITANNGMVSTPTPDTIDERNLLMEKIGKSGDGKPLIKSRNCKNGKKLHLLDQSLEIEHNSMASTFSTDCAFRSIDKKLSKIGAVKDVSLKVGESQQLKAAPEAQSAYYHSANNRIERLNKCTNNEVEKNSDKPELPPFFSFGDCWSDPCFEFAFKTLTGAIPVEDNLPVQSYFQQQIDTSQTQREGYFQQVVDTSQTPRDGSLALPDFGLPSFFQTDISVHFDAPDKQLATQMHVPLSNPSFMPSGSVSLPSCSSIGSQQQPHLKENKGLRGKVNS
ncbi:methyl-CpG-binding domain-containing protein 13 isoform X1 [Ricinus communis]|uniref:methyl-CpG-binding domain-containing protein 13 isoform X1 n=2 Tax=Ricinus communis TaxID=3988 RepID=UPI00201B0455|nr:methyl-CpG-binding domain-containing protein 13 isoform X1 [Ricinus communis]